MFRRLRKLWEMSGREDDSIKEGKTFPGYYDGNELVLGEKPTRMATVMQDDPLDIFPSDRPEEEVESD